MTVRTGPGSQTALAERVGGTRFRAVTWHRRRKLRLSLCQHTCFGSRGSPVRIRAPRLGKMKYYSDLCRCGVFPFRRTMDRGHHIVTTESRFRPLFPRPRHGRNTGLWLRAGRFRITPHVSFPLRRPDILSLGFSSCFGPYRRRSCEARWWSDGWVSGCLDWIQRYPYDPPTRSQDSYSRYGDLEERQLPYVSAHLRHPAPPRRRQRAYSPETHGPRRHPYNHDLPPCHRPDRPGRAKPARPIGRRKARKASLGPRLSSRAGALPTLGYSFPPSRQ